MFIDARSLDQDTTVESDVCIIGAGAAGISIALELAGTGTNVCVLESGGFNYELDTQQLYQGENAGRPYYPLTVTRLRFLGGTTNHWGGFSRMLDKSDFEKRDWIPHSGWPISREDLMPYYARAHELCQLGPPRYDLAYWAGDDTPPLAFGNAQDRGYRLAAAGDGAAPALPGGEGPVVSGVYQNSTPTRFGQQYRAALEKAPDVKVFLHANVLDIGLRRAGDSVRRLLVSTLKGNRFEVHAKRYILATGGIENPRMLLLSNSVQQQGIGNRYDLVGRYFLEHPIMETGRVLLNPSVNASLYRRHPVRGVPIQGFLTLSEEARQSNRMLNCGMLLEHMTWADSSPGSRSAKDLYDSAAHLHYPDHFVKDVEQIVADFSGVANAAYNDVRDRQLFRLIYWGEAVPNPDSRVSLSEQKDRFGKPRVRLAWRLSERDKQNLFRMHEMVGNQLGSAGLGRLKMELQEEQDGWPFDVHGSHHHMGTTRMSDDPKTGVVDRNCRVHGVDNLFVAGSSVFPISGQANPTMNLVALAVRLADHIKRTPV